MQKTAALILAAGKGTRMHSDKPKVLQCLLNIPMLAYVIEALQGVCAGHIWSVIGHKAELIRKQFDKNETHFIVQEEQRGTGHALQVALPILIEQNYEAAIIINGDVPLIDAQVLQHFLNEASGKDLAFATLKLTDAANYGRVIRKNGQVTAIVEAKDFDQSIHGSITGEVNAGLYYISMQTAKEFLPKLTSENKSREYYITDLVGLMVQAGRKVYGVECGNNTQLLGVNSPLELVEAEEILRKQIVHKTLENGVIIHAPNQVRISPKTTIEPGAEIFGPCEIYGQSHIAKVTQIQSHCVIISSHIAEGAKILSFSHLEEATVGKNTQVGPYGRLRPGAILKEESKIGNFVEVKKSTIECGAKVSHLSYIGDASVGEGANIGAGTITCNYDGKNKHKTTIGAGAFIGSNTALVAPVDVGNNALIGAGSVITKNVPDANLGISRAPQKTLPRRDKF